MRTMFFLAGLLFTSSALASETVYAVEETPSARFPDSETPGPVFAKGARLTILVEEGQRIRVRSASGYGWISAAAVTAEAPARPSSASGMPATLNGQEFDLDAIKKMLEQQ